MEIIKLSQNLSEKEIKKINKRIEEIGYTPFISLMKWGKEDNIVDIRYYGNKTKEGVWLEYIRMIDVHLDTNKETIASFFTKYVGEETAKEIQKAIIEFLEKEEINMGKIKMQTDLIAYFLLEREEIQWEYGADYDDYVPQRYSNTSLERKEFLMEDASKIFEEEDGDGDERGSWDKTVILVTNKKDRVIFNRNKALNINDLERMKNQFIEVCAQGVALRSHTDEDVTTNKIDENVSEVVVSEPNEIVRGG